MSVNVRRTPQTTEASKSLGFRLFELIGVMYEEAICGAPKIVRAQFWKPAIESVLQHDRKTRFTAVCCPTAALVLTKTTGRFSLSRNRFTLKVVTQ
jgi:hypothetical protein